MKRVLSLLLIAALGAGVTLAAMSFIRGENKAVAHRVAERVTERLKDRTKQLKEFIREHGLEPPAATDASQTSSGSTPPVVVKPQPNPEPSRNKPPNKPPPEPPKPEPPEPRDCDIKVGPVCQDLPA